MKPKKTTKPTKANPLKQNLLSGLGLVSMTNTKVGEMAKSLARGRQHSAEEGDKLAAQILRQAKETKKHLEKRVTDLVRETSEKMRGPSLADFRRLESEVAKLQKTLSRIEAKQTPRRK
jgi:polyhydroxyalkanoate synthesis regulator phasin